MKYLFLFNLWALSCLMSGCSKTEVDAPCTHYGRYCDQIPVNAWNAYEEGRPS